MNKAKSLAVASLAVRTGRPTQDLPVLDELTQCRRSGWIFFYESRGPVVVTHGGEVHHLPAERPVDEVLREFENTQRRATPKG